MFSRRSVAETGLMDKRLATAALKVHDLLQGALLIVSTVVVFFPTARTPVLRVVCMVLVAIVFAWSIWDTWRAGWLTMTPSQIFRAVQQGSPARRRSPLDLLATVMGLAALYVLT